MLFRLKLQRRLVWFSLLLGEQRTTVTVIDFVGNMVAQKTIGDSLNAL